MRNKPLLILFLSLYTFSSCFSQTDTIIKGWKLGINFAPEIAFRQLKSDDKSEIIQAILTQRNEMEIPATLFTAGISAEYRISKLLSIRSGFHYSLRGERSKDIGLWPDNEYPGFGSNIEKSIYRNQFHYIGFPLQAQVYYVSTKRIQLFATAGFGFEFMYLTSYRNTTKQFNEEETKFKSRLNLKQDFYNYGVFNISVIASMGFDWKIGARSTIRIEPVYRRSLLPVTNTPIKGYYYNYGINFGYIRTLKIKAKNTNPQ